MSPMTPILFFHPFQILSCRGCPSRGYVRCLLESSSKGARRGRSPVPDWSFGACARCGDLPWRAEL